MAETRKTPKLPEGYSVGYDIDTCYTSLDKALLYAPDGSLIGQWSLDVYGVNQRTLLRKVRERAKMHLNYSLVKRGKSNG